VSEWVEWKWRSLKLITNPPPPNTTWPTPEPPHETELGGEHRYAQPTRREGSALLSKQGELGIAKRRNFGELLEREVAGGEEEWGQEKNNKNFVEKIIDMLLMEKINNWIILGNLFNAG